MKILLLGANGQLGRELKRKLTNLGTLKACSRDEVDFTDSNSLTATIEAFKPNIIVNAAAYTAVDKAEHEYDLAFQVNAKAVAVLANEALKHNIWLIHYSTDYVFDGAKQQPYVETDAPNPLNVYGKSKLAGEQAVTASGCKHLIFRTSWVIGQDGQNFVKTILRLATERNSLEIINDQLGAPTTPALIAEITINAIAATRTSSPWPIGLYHLAPHGQTTWFGIAQTLMQLATAQEFALSINESTLYPIASADYPTLATRPANSLLDTRKLTQQLSFNLPHWQYGFSKVANTIIRELK